MADGLHQPTTTTCCTRSRTSSFQELATRISHRNTGKLTGDPICEQLLARIAADENLHMVFYRNLLGAAFELDPDQTMRAVDRRGRRASRCPATASTGFGRKAVQIAMAGIYDLRIHHDEVLMPVLRQLGVLERTDLGADGEKAREELVEFLDGLDTHATRFVERREARRARRRRRLTPSFAGAASWWFPAVHRTAVATSSRAGSGRCPAPQAAQEGQHEQGGQTGRDREGRRRPGPRRNGPRAGRRRPRRGRCPGRWSR